MLRCTDNLNDEGLVASLRSYYTTNDAGGLYTRSDGKEVKQCKRVGNYKGITFKGRLYLSHRVIYAIVNGPFNSHIDHIDGDPTNNSPSNLRLCTQGLNVANARVRSDNTTGYTGVIWHKASNKWQAQTMFNGKRVHIGLFSCRKEAALAYNHKLTELFGHQCTFNKVF
jgi:hypothetical protein